METGKIWTRRRALAALLSAAGSLWVGASGARAQADGARVAETAAGNAVCDAMRALTGADVALLPASGFRTAGEARTITVGDAAALLGTASDTVVVMNLTGKQLADALERSVSYAPKPFAGFLQVSGIEVRFSRKRPGGARITALRKAGKPIEPTARLRVAMPRPLADGQLGYFQIWSKDQIALDTGKSLADAAAAARATSVSVDGRLVGSDD